jgi:tetratricopeptide (TPR) repeat protein
MKRILILLGLLGIPSLVGAGVYWQRTHALAPQLAKARALAGTKQGAALLERLAARYPDQAEVHFLLARQLGYDSKDAQAEVHLNRAAALAWPKADIERQRWLLAAGQNFRKAEPHLQAILDANPQDREVLLSLALGYSRIDRLPMAETLVNRVLQRDPKDGPALTLRGKLYLQQQRRDVALEDLRQAVARGRDQFYYLTARVLLSICMRQLGQYDQAYQLAKECREEDPENALVLFGIGLCARHLDRPDEALEAFEAVLRVRPNDADTLFEMAHIYDSKGDFPKALEVLQQVEKNYPEDPQLLIQMAKTLQAMGDAKGAAEYQKKYQDMVKRTQQKLLQARDGADEDRAPPPRTEPVDK